MSYDIDDEIKMLSKTQLELEYLEANNKIGNLVAEVERLKQENEKTKQFWYEHLEQEKELFRFKIEQLREALKMCSPWEAYVPESTNIWMPCCKFCRHISVQDITLEESMKYHTDDCEYVKLTQEA